MRERNNGKMMKKLFALLLLSCLCLCGAKTPARVVEGNDWEEHILESAAGNYQIGVGKYDVTGPSAEVNMMGYAMPQQTAAGIHLRQWARAYIFVDQTSGKRVVFVNNDLCMVMQSVKYTVVERLAAIFGNLYINDNVILTGIHTHSGPGGYSWYTLYDVTSLGYVRQNFEAVVNGIVNAIVIAHKNLKSANIEIATSWMYNANINRSPTAYLANPAQERALYDGDTDKNITVLKLTQPSGPDLGVIAWFAVHCTSMNNTNKLISSDNKGYASYLFEKIQNGNVTYPFSEIPFVASFAQSNEGDVSPNTKGPSCPDGSPCDADSLCDGKNEGCIGKGPGANMFESTQIIANYQYDKAREMYESATTVISGPIDYRHMFVNMTDFTVSGNFTFNGQPNTTCRAAMGYSFAAGTTDGPGAFDFYQGDNQTSNPFWNFVGDFLAKPTKEQIDCQHPKPILLDVGGVEPVPWTPDVVPVQIVSIGQLYILAVPGEFTTMSGRRLRNTVQKVLEKAGIMNSYIVISGLSNTYTGYITTFEEYHVQRYEGASTIFGPHTLSAYQDVFTQLATALVTNTPVPVGPAPRNLTGRELTFLPPVLLDTVPSGVKFGQVHTDVMSSYQIGATVEVVFYGAIPRNNLMTGSTFLVVQKKNSAGNWVPILSDSDWDTKFIWKREGTTESLITVTWDIAPQTLPGNYTIQHFGYAKTELLSEKLTSYSGISSEFSVA